MNNIAFNDVPTIYEHMKGLISLKKDISGKDKTIKEIEVEVLLGRMFNVVSNFYINLEKASKDIQSKLPLEEIKPETKGEGSVAKPSDTTNSSVKPVASTQPITNAPGVTKEAPKPSGETAEELKARQAREIGAQALADKQEADRKAKELADANKNVKPAAAPVADTKAAVQPVAPVAAKEDTSTEHCATLPEAYEKILPFTMEEVKKHPKDKLFSDEKFRGILHQMLRKFCPADSDHAIDPNSTGVSAQDVKRGREMRNKAISFLEGETNRRIKLGAVESTKAANIGEGKVISMTPKPVAPVAITTQPATQPTVTQPAPEKGKEEEKLDSKSNEAADAALAELAKAEQSEQKEKTIVAPTTVPKNTLYVDVASGATSDKPIVNTTVADDDITDADIAAVEDPNLKAFREHLTKRLAEKGILDSTKRDSVFNWGVTLLQMRKEEWIKQPLEVEGVMQTKAHNYVLKLIENDIATLRKAS